MITKFKVFENEITINNTSGKVGDNVDLKDGYFRSGNTGDFGISFIKKGDIDNKSYKLKKIKNKRFIKNKRKHDKKI